MPPMSTPRPLKDPSLLKTEGLINGQWVTGASRLPCTTRPPD